MLVGGRIVYYVSDIFSCPVQQNLTPSWVIFDKGGQVVDISIVGYPQVISMGVSRHLFSGELCTMLCNNTRHCVNSSPGLPKYNHVMRYHWPIGFGPGKLIKQSPELPTTPAEIN